MGGLAVAALLAAVAVGSARSARALTRASWPCRSPAAAILLWQALGLAGGLAAIGALLTVGVDGQQTRFAGVFGGLGRLASGQLLQPHQPPLIATLRLAMLAAGFALLSVLMWMLVVAFADEPPPSVYRSLVDTPRTAYAVGVRLQAGADRTVTMHWSPSDRDDEPEVAPEAFRACVESGIDTAWHGGGRAWHWTQHGHA